LELQEDCAREGLGFPRIEAWEPVRGGGPGAAYVLSASAAYGLKGGAAVLDLNGGRYGSWTRGFFGMPYGEALSEAARSVHSEDRISVAEVTLGGVTLGEGLPMAPVAEWHLEKEGLGISPAAEAERLLGALSRVVRRG
jgi:hypothetical protein